MHCLIFGFFSLRKEELTPIQLISGVENTLWEPSSLLGIAIPSVTPLYDKYPPPSTVCKSADRAILLLHGGVFV